MSIYARTSNAVRVGRGLFSPISAHICPEIFFPFFGGLMFPISKPVLVARGLPNPSVCPFPVRARQSGMLVAVFSFAPGDRRGVAENAKATFHGNLETRSHPQRAKTAHWKLTTDLKKDGKGPFAGRR